MPQSADQFSGIFISYRRASSVGHAGRLYDRLALHFGHEQVFIDMLHIEEGDKFDSYTERALSSCEIFIAVIDRNWLASADERGRRLDDPEDYVRREIATALRRDVAIVPVRVQGATMPRPRDLPEELRPFCFHQAGELRDGLDWYNDASRLITTVKRLLAERRDARRREEKERRRRARELARASRSGRAAGPLFTLRVREGSGGAIAVVGILALLVMTASLFLVPRKERGQEVERVPDLPPIEKPLEIFTETIKGLGDYKELKMVRVPVHRDPFVMGLSWMELRRDEEAPLPHVETVDGFYISMYEVTRAQWRAVMGGDKNPSRFDSEDDLPVDNVPFFQAKQFCDRLSDMTKKEYRLPKEKEWEYAARAGKKYVPFAFGPSLSYRQANFDGCSPYGGAPKAPDCDAPKGPKSGRTVPVGCYEPNEWQLYDMHGNVWEWCDDYYIPKIPPASQPNDRVLRGGDWDSPAASLRSGYRIGSDPRRINERLAIGFRVATDAP